MTFLELIRLREFVLKMLAIPDAERPAPGLVLDAIRREAPELYRSALHAVRTVRLESMSDLTALVSGIIPRHRAWVDALLAEAKHRANGPPDNSTSDLTKSA